MADKEDKIKRALSPIIGSGDEKAKSPKEAVLYVLRPETQYTCDKCVFYKDGNPPKCAIFGPTIDIKAYGSCGFWIHGDPTKMVVPLMGLVTKEEAGYAENPQGFSCKRCEYFDSGASRCEKVRADSPGDTPGIIHPNACCNRWEADDSRAKMTTEQLTRSLMKPHK